MPQLLISSQEVLSHEQVHPYGANVFFIGYSYLFAAVLMLRSMLVLANPARLVNG